MQKRSQVRTMMLLAILGAWGVILRFFEFPILPAAPFLKIDFSDVPAMMAALIFSPIAGVIVLAIKNVLYWLVSGAGEPIGVLSNFVAGLMFIVPVALFYHKFKGVKSIVSGLVTGTIVMAFGMSVLNYFLILPAYGWFMGWEMSETIRWNTVLIGILPFNMIKGMIVGLLFVPLFVKMRSWIEQKQAKVAA